jgi:AcrR family transcriptional regulator
MSATLFDRVTLTLMPEPVKRPYDSSRRRDQARQTRARIVDAAGELFVERGYAATSVATIAERAGVAPQTVYGAFGTKAAVLVAAINVAVAGDDEQVALFDRPEMTDLATGTDGAAVAAGIAGMCRRLLERAGPLLHAADEAAVTDPALGELWARGHGMRLADMRRLARDLERSGLLRDDLDRGSAADILFALTSPETYRTFTVAREWSPGRYETWLRTTLARVLLQST